MKKALSYKILLVIMALAFSLALVFSFGGVKPALAHDVTSPTGAFSGGQAIVFADNNVKATVKSGDAVKITNQLVVDDLAINLEIPATVTKYTVTLTYDSFFENEFTADVENDFDLTTTGDVTIAISTVNNVLTVNGVSKADLKYKIAGADKCVAKIKVTFTLNDGIDNADVLFKYIDQKASDASGTYKQTFAFDGEKITKLATPRVSINNLPAVKDASGNIKILKDTRYTFSSFKAYSLFEDDSVGTDFYIDKDSVGDNAWVDPYSAMPRSVAFKADTAFKIRTSGKADLETYSVKVFTADDDTTAPKYIDYNKTLYDNYKVLVEKASKSSDGTHSIYLGDEFEIPSLEGLVYDDYNVYSDLETTVYYKTPSKSSSTSAMSFIVGEAGEYEFYVVFADKSGNSMEKDDFYTVDDDEQTITEKGYYNAVFKFTIEDDAPMSVESSIVKQSDGYLNTKYTATSFKIESSGYNVKYTLSYNADVNATAASDGWIALPSVSDITEEYDENGFTYADISNIAYDGEYTFTPVKLGAYKIDCEITSDKSERSASGSTVIKVEKEPTEVKVDTHWFKNNLWSIIFLSVGTLALIGIIVLLFIKPKEEVETDETGDALKAKENK